MKHPPCPACAAGALLAVTLVACRALPALHYYSLATVSPVASAVHPLAPLLIRVRHVSLPHEMDHLGLTHHLGPTQLTISDNDQWTAPLDGLIQGTITSDLGERLGYQQVIAADALPVAAHPAAANLDLDFVTLSADDHCSIAAQVNWTLSLPGGATRRGSARVAAPAAVGCPAGLPTSLSTALGELADQLVPQLTVS
ncbi:MAG TPA: ABC-type transport auxiliary lipoprotein family protein [Steroidobacteraceae bacterium]|jgi:uncharacterized lipoprotein YmbA|nr:ABC-type transport auxiliary lipoprotein family protein [Steroidobacteraceae bacterium]